MPAIDIGNMFDENDHWISSLLNNSTEFEEAVKEIQTDPEYLEYQKTQNLVEKVPVEVVKSVNDSSETLPVVIGSTVDIHEKPKKSVSFGVAWEGKLETVQIIPSEYQLYPIGATGRLLLKCRFIFSNF
jgi:hypothetical protein